MPLIPFPNIPALPGVPALPRLPGVSTGTVVQAALGIIQGALWAALQTDVRWGIFDQTGNPLADPSKLTGITATLVNSAGLGSTLSTVAVEYSKESQVSDFPVERGFFANYNKVQTPGAASVTFAFTGSESDRNKFLDSIDKASKSTDLYDVVTPEMTYVQYNIEGYAYQRRAERGATLLIVELHLKEIRQVSAQYFNTQTQAKSPANPDAAAKVNAGKVQPLNPVQSVLYAVGDKITNLAATAIQQAKGSP